MITRGLGDREAALENPVPGNASMNVRQIIGLFKNSSESNEEASHGCLSPRQLAAYQDAALHGGERALAETHLAVCDRCLGQLAAVNRAAAVRDAEPGVPASLIERAEAMYTSPAQVAARSRRRWALPLAATAALLLTLGLVLDPLLDPADSPGNPGAPQTRLANPELARPRILAPAADSVVRPSEQVFLWSEVPGTLFYDVRVVSPDGDLLLRERVTRTRWLLPEDLQLKPGEEYFVRVDAYLSDAKYLSSNHHVFRVGGVR